jgi:hypothetical protein
MEPIKFVNYASGGVNKWSISHQLPSGLVFDKQKGIISGTPTVACIIRANRYMKLSAFTND